MKTITIKVEELNCFKEFIDIKNEIQCLSISKRYGYKFDINDSDEVKKHIESLRNNINEKQNMRETLAEIESLIPNINNKKLKEIEIIEFKDVTEDEMKKIFSYIYWEYKQKNSEFKVNLVKLKKLLNFERGKELYIYPILFKQKCNCGKFGVLGVYGYGGDRKFTFECSCGHKEDYDYGYDYGNWSLVNNCKCEYCKNLKKNFFNILKKNLKNWMEVISTSIKEEYLKIEDINDVNEKEMLMHYEENFKKLNKIEKKVIKSNFKTFRQLQERLELIVVKNINWEEVEYGLEEETSYYIDSLRRKKVFYYVCKKLPQNQINDIVQSVIFDEVVTISHKKLDNLNNYDKNKYLYEILKYIENSELEYFYDKKFRYKFIINDIVADFDNLFTRTFFYKDPLEKICISLDEKYFNTHYTFNKYYITREKNANRKTTINTSLIKNFFKDKSQKEQFLTIYNEYENPIITSEVEFKKVVDLDKFKSILNEEEFNYLKTCTLDFVVYNLQGEIERVLDSKEEEIKKRIFSFLNIEYSLIK